VGLRANDDAGNFHSLHSEREEDDERVEGRGRERDLPAYQEGKEGNGRKNKDANHLQTEVEKEDENRASEGEREGHRFKFLFVFSSDVRNEPRFFGRRQGRLWRELRKTGLAAQRRGSKGSFRIEKGIAGRQEMRERGGQRIW